MSQNEKYYRTCPYCGANNDPGETCDCLKERDNDVNNYKSVCKRKGEEKDEDTAQKK